MSEWRIKSAYTGYASNVVFELDSPRYGHVKVRVWPDDGTVCVIQAPTIAAMCSSHYLLIDELAKEAV